MSRTIAIANHKGGVGKTTTVLSLGAALSLKGKKVLLVDLDAQCNLTTQASGGRLHGRTVFDSLIGGGSLPVYRAAGYDYVPATSDLTGIERALTVTVGDNRAESVLLRHALLPLREEYDYILIDCPPSLGVLTRNALTAADGVLVPLTAESVPVMGMRSLMEAVDLTRRGLNGGLKVDGILVVRYNRRKLNRIVEEHLREIYGSLVFKTRIRENVDLMESPLYGKDIFGYASESIGAADYKSLAEELLERIEKY